MRVRDLKRVILFVIVNVSVVAPLAGAQIEILSRLRKFICGITTGARIETTSTL